MKLVRGLRWHVAALLTVATALNYLDRQSLPVVISEVQKEIPITDQQYSQLQVLFLLAYGVMYAAGGMLVDVLGTRIGYVVMIVWWSVANALHGFANSVWTLGACRFLLGLGEGGGFPASAKAVSEWFPPRERSFAFGLFNTGSSVGAVAAPPLIALLVSVSNWRWVFFVSGAAGIVWAVAWHGFYRLPAVHPKISSEERRLIEPSIGEPATQEGRVAWRDLARNRAVWTLALVKFLTDAAWYFFVFWLPRYLVEVRHLDIRGIGASAWIPYAAAGVGSLLGGWFSSYLMRRNFSLNAARKLALACAAGLMPSSLLVTDASLEMALLLFSLAFLGHQFWSTIVQTLPADMFPSSCVGRVAGLLGAAGSVGGMVFNLLVGWWLTQTHSYSVILTVAGLLHLVSLGLILVFIPRIERVAPARGTVAAAQAHR